MESKLDYRQNTAHNVFPSLVLHSENSCRLMKTTFHVDECTPRSLSALLELFCNKLGYFKENSITTADIVISWGAHYDRIKSVVTGEVVSPAWVIGSMICGCHLPTEEYHLQSKYFLSGLAISVADISPHLSSYRHAYTTMISCYGGRVYRSESPLCTHILRRESSVDLYSYENRLKVSKEMLFIYNYLIDNYRSADMNSVQAAFDDASIESNLRWQPVVVPEQWIIDGIIQRERADETHPGYSALVPKHSLLSLHTLCTQLHDQVSMHCSFPCPVNVDTKRQQHTAQEEILLRQLTALTRSRPDGIKIFGEKDFFLLSRQYKGPRRFFLESTIRFMGASVLEFGDVESLLIDSSGGALYLVSPDVPSGAKLEGVVSAVTATSSILIVRVSDIYLYECLDVGAVIPIEDKSGEATGSEDPASTLSYWNYVCSAGEESKSTLLENRDLLLKALGRCCAPIYTPVREVDGIPALQGCVISISGYIPITQLNGLQQFPKNGKTTNGGKNNRSTIGATAAPKMGRTELEHAITLSGACYCGPLLVAVATHLICAKCEGSKYDAVSEYNRQNPANPIHVVSEDWIFDCLRSWSRVDEEKYPVVPASHWIAAGGEEKGIASDAETAGDRSCTRNATPMDTTPTVPLADGTEVPSGVQLKQDTPAISQAAHVQEYVTSRGTTTPLRSQCDRPVFLIAGRTDKKYKAMEKEVKAIICRLGGRVVSYGGNSSNHPTPESTSRVNGDTGGGAALTQTSASESANRRSKYEPSCTHIVMWELRRTEKFLCGCAAGKWIMHPDYLKDSDAAGMFLEEDTYEWGYSQSADMPPLRAGAIESKIWHKCCSRGRENAEAGRRPFEGIPVVLLGPPQSGKPVEICKGPTRDVLEAIVRAGGGIVLNTDLTTDPFLQGGDVGIVVSCCADHLNAHARERKECVMTPSDLMDIITGPSQWRTVETNGKSISTKRVLADTSASPTTSSSKRFRAAT